MSYIKSYFEKDYATDWVDFNIKYGKDLIKNNSSIFDKIQKEIIESKNVAHACFFACDTNYLTYKMQEIILKSNNLKYIVLFARCVKNADIKALQKAILESSSPERIKYLCKFACQISGSNKKKIENILAKEVTGKLARYAHMFVKNVKGADINKFKKTIIESGKPRYLYWLAKHLKTRREIALIEKLIINAQSFLYIRLMAQHIPKANLNKLEQFVLDSGNVKQIKKFAKSVKQSKSRHLTILF